MDGTAAPRVLALWCPDWPVVAATAEAGVPAHRPAAVVAANRVLACTAPARAYGVRRGLRRREAQARCPELAVLPADPGRDARAFERVAVAVERLAPGVEVVRPGLVALPAKGPVRYFGGDLPAAERLVDQVAAEAGVESQVGIADGLFGAVLAARRAVAVEPGDTPRFLARLPIEELDRDPDVDRAELVSLLRRLGLLNLGSFAALPAADVASRFGADAVLAHRLALGLDPRPPARREVAEEPAVSVEFDPPVTRVDAAAFASRSLADRLHALLAGRGLACTRLGIRARTLDGAELVRVWRCAEPLTPSGTVDRVRWQLDAWLTRARVNGATGGPGGVTTLTLSGEEVVPAGALQLGLWGEVGVADERAGRALVRVQALLGPEGVCTAVLGGGRDPGERVRLVPWGDERAGGEEPGGTPTDSRTPAQARSWPGRLPAPSPTTVPARPAPVEVLDGAGRPVRIDERQLIGAAPAWVLVDGGRARPVTGWAGPWPVDQRWWDAEAGWRGCRLQVVLGEGAGGPGGAGAVGRDGHADDAEEALLLVCREGERWTLAGRYD
jgi:protein ImuB